MDELGAIEKQLARPGEVSADFRSFADSLPVMIWVTGEDSFRTFVNRRWVEFTGRSPDSELAHGWMEDVHPEDLAGCVERFFEAFLARRRFEVEFRVRRADGAYRWLLDTGVPRYDETGRFLGYVGSSLDVTARREAESALEDNRQWLRDMLGTIADGVIATDRDDHILFANPVAGRLLGVDSLLGENLDSIFRWRLASDAPQPENEVFEAILLPAAGGEIPVEICLSRIHGPASSASGKLVVFRDISERKRAQAEAARQALELQRSNEELAQFASMASHDLQEPLRTVGSYTQLLARRYTGKLGPDADEFISFILEGVNRMSTLIKSVLAYSRVGADAPRIKPVEVDGVLNDCQRNLRYALDRSGAKLEIGAMPTVTADRSQLVQLFQNLLSNAIKYRSDRPLEIQVFCEEHPSEWKFGVRDNGIGIDQRFHERIFQTFRRVSGHGQRGSGIGLAICKKIAERHRGRIWVESVPGEGSTFWFTLPFA